jgi:hypothetical protein
MNNINIIANIMHKIIVIEHGIMYQIFLPSSTSGPSL